MSVHSLAGLVALNALFFASGLAVLWLVRGSGDLDRHRAGSQDSPTSLASSYVGSIWTMLLIVGVPFSLGLVPRDLRCRHRCRVVCCSTTIADGSGAPHVRHAQPDARHGDWHLRFRARARGLLSRRAPVRSLLVGRLVVLGAEGESDLLLRKHRRRVLQAASRLVLSAARPRARRGRVQVHGKSRRRDAPRPVLALRRRRSSGRSPGFSPSGFPTGSSGRSCSSSSSRRESGRVSSSPRRISSSTSSSCWRAVLLFTWLRDRDMWRLVTGVVLICGAVLTKREGMLLAALLLFTTFAVTVRERGSAWRSLAVATVAVILVAAPWRIWYVAHGLSGETPTGGPNTERFFPSFRLAFDVLFSSAYWSVLVPVAIGALGLGLLVRALRPGLFFGLLVAARDARRGMDHMGHPRARDHSGLRRQTRSCGTWAPQRFSARQRPRCFLAGAWRAVSRRSDDRPMTRRVWLAAAIVAVRSSSMSARRSPTALLASRRGGECLHPAVEGAAGRSRLRALRLARERDDFSRSCRRRRLHRDRCDRGRLRAVESRARGRPERRDRAQVRARPGKPVLTPTLELAADG